MPPLQSQKFSHQGKESLFSLSSLVLSQDWELQKMELPSPPIPTVFARGSDL